MVNEQWLITGHQFSMLTKSLHRLFRFE